MKDYGYRIIGVEALLKLSPFVDLEPDAPYAEAVRGILERKLPVGFRDNTFRPNQPLLFGEACAILAPEEERLRRIELKRQGETRINGLSLDNHYSSAYS
ncbi:MAG TPA: S-layer homology domain-containing protein [Clostridiales bacterium]|nr:S-layer homology domain-containing protein [Clostridiales bacterium]